MGRTWIQWLCDNVGTIWYMVDIVITDLFAKFYIQGTDSTTLHCSIENKGEWHEISFQWWTSTEKKQIIDGNSLSITQYNRCMRRPVKRFPCNIYAYFILFFFLVQSLKDYRCHWRSCTWAFFKDIVAMDHCPYCIFHNDLPISHFKHVFFLVRVVPEVEIAW